MEKNSLDLPLEKSVSLTNVNHLTLISNQSNSNGTDRMARIILIGDSGVGKSSIILRYLQDDFKEKFPCTAGVEIGTKTLTIDGEEIKLQIWDTAGQERYRNVTKSFFKSALGVLIVFDLTSKESFKNLEEWFNLIDQHAPEDVSICVLGNKIDLKKEITVKHEEINQFLENKIAKYYEVSAKSGLNIEKAFFEISQSIKQKKFDNQKNGDGVKSMRLSSSASPYSPELRLKFRRDSKKGCC